MINFTWVIPNLECVISENGLQDVVDAVHWRYVATDDVNNVSVDTYGVQSMPEPSSSDFIPYSGLTLEVVSVWLENAIDIQPMQEDLTNKINLILNPIKVNLPLPNQNQNQI
jgi:hypothetical protein